MIFMSQSGLLDRSRDAEWDSWYVEHCRAMATVPGIASAQRFRADTRGSPPSLAMYSIASPEVFEDPYYLSVRGFREWQPQIDTQCYRRNLFAGLDHAPVFREGELLFVVDCAAPAEAGSGRDLVWLESVGLDCSTPFRGIAVIDDAASASAGSVGPAGAVYRAVTRRFGDSS